MKLFTRTDSDTALYPRENEQVARLRAELAPAKDVADTAEAERRRILNEIQPYDGISRMEPPDLNYQRVKQVARDAAQLLERATAAHALALEAATQRARQAWDEQIREGFLDDMPTIDAFLDLLTKYERWVAEAGEAGVDNVLNLPQLFLTANEVRGRLDYARRALGLE